MKEPHIISPDDQNPNGFRTSASGLIVPEDMAREKEAFTVEEWDLVEKVARLAVKKTMIFRFFCMHPACQTKEGPQLAEILDTPEGRVLRCNHKDRRLAEADAKRESRIAHAAQRRLRRAARHGS